MEKSFAANFKNWRRLSSFTQHSIAGKLGVTQQAVSNWERGLDVPSQQVMLMIKALMSNANNNELIIEQAFIKNQTAIRALVDTDGAKLLGYSAGFEKAWGAFCELKDQFVEDKLINEMLTLASNNEYRKQILGGEIVVISGTSTQHVDVSLGKPFLHNWHACYRNLGGLIVADMVYEPAEDYAETGIHNILRISDIKS